MPKIKGTRRRIDKDSMDEESIRYNRESKRKRDDHSFFFRDVGKVPGSRLLQQRTGFFFVMAVLCIQGLFLIYLICALFTYVPLLKDVIAHK